MVPLFVPNLSPSIGSPFYVTVPTWWYKSVINHVSYAYNVFFPCVSFDFSLSHWMHIATPCPSYVSSTMTRLCSSCWCSLLISHSTVVYILTRWTWNGEHGRLNTTTTYSCTAALLLIWGTAHIDWCLRVTNARRGVSTQHDRIIDPITRVLLCWASSSCRCSYTLRSTRLQTQEQIKGILAQNTRTNWLNWTFILQLNCPCNSGKTDVGWYIDAAGMGTRGWLQAITRNSYYV